MNEILSVFLDCDPYRRETEELINQMDREIEKAGWKYTGFRNIYRPIDETTRDDTICDVVHVLESTEWLKPYRPQVMAGNWMDSIALKDIDVSKMTAPSWKKLERYENYYQSRKEMAHGIVVDENGKIRDGYISYLLAWKYSVKVDIVRAWSHQPLNKVVIGRHVQWNGDHYLEKSRKLYCWIYDLREAVIPGDILLVCTDKGLVHMKVARIGYITGKIECSRYKKVKQNVTARFDSRTVKKTENVCAKTE